jgi:hypothetical protein
MDTAWNIVFAAAVSALTMILSVDAVGGSLATQK